MDDVAHYVVKSRARSTYYVKATLGWHFEKADGVVTLRRTPAVAYDRPVRVGKSWELSYRREDRTGQAQEFYRKCTAVDETTLTVPAGSFLTLHVVCRDRAKRFRVLHQGPRTFGDLERSLSTQELIGFVQR